MSLHIQKSASEIAEVDSVIKQIEFTYHTSVFLIKDTNRKAVILKNKLA